MKRYEIVGYYEHPSVELLFSFQWTILSMFVKFIKSCQKIPCVKLA